MKNILVTGADRVVGANLAAALAEQFRVFAVSENGTTIAGCECCKLDVIDPLSVQQFAARIDADIIIHCSPTAESSWGDDPNTTGEVPAIKNLASAANSLGAKLVLISGDQIYRGPWLFHSEQSDCLADTAIARTIGEYEGIVAACEGSLVLRTHVLGWSPDGQGTLELMLSDLERGVPFSFGHYATPMAASQFAAIVLDCLTNDLTGRFNVAGAERCSQFGFASALALNFDLPEPTAAEADIANETTLSSDSIRRAIGISLPTVNETVAALELAHEYRADTFDVTTLSRAA